MNTALTTVKTKDPLGKIVGVTKVGCEILISCIIPKHDEKMNFEMLQLERLSTHMTG